MALDHSGMLYLWGMGSFGSFKQPEPITSIPKRAIDGQVGSQMGAVVDEEGRIWVWGENRKGELGVGDCSKRNNPYPLALLGNKAIKSVSVGANFAVAIGSENQKMDAETADKNNSLVTEQLESQSEQLSNHQPAPRHH